MSLPPVNNQGNGLPPPAPPVIVNPQKRNLDAIVLDQDPHKRQRQQEVIALAQEAISLISRLPEPNWHEPTPNISVLLDRSLDSFKKDLTSFKLAHYQTTHLANIHLTPPGNSGLERLPLDLLKIIFSKLGIRDLERTSKVSPYFLRVSDLQKIHLISTKRMSLYILRSKFFNRDQITYLIQRNKNNPDFKYIDFSNYFEDESELELLTEIRHLETLKCYSESGYVQDKHVEAIASNLTNLTRLELGNNQINVQGAQAIARTLTRLTYLDLQHNEFDDDGARALAAGILTNLTYLDLGGTNITGEGIKAIADAFSSLKTLDVTQYGFEGTLVELTPNSLPNLTTWISVGAERDIDDIARLVEACPNLTNLNLGDTETDNEEAKSIATLTNLRSLHISGDIERDGVMAIATLTNLRSLVLRTDSFDTEGAIALARSLPKLTELNLDFSRINIDGILAIAKMTNLTDLTVYNRGDIETAKIFALSLTNLKRIFVKNHSYLFPDLPKARWDKEEEFDPDDIDIKAIRTFRQNLPRPTISEYDSDDDAS